VESIALAFVLGLNIIAFGNTMGVPTEFARIARFLHYRHCVAFTGEFAVRPFIALHPALQTAISHYGRLLMAPQSGAELFDFIFIHYPYCFFFIYKFNALRVLSQDFIIFNILPDIIPL
jgi:hypothetical protein